MQYFISVLITQFNYYRYMYLLFKRIICSSVYDLLKKLYYKDFCIILGICSEPVSLGQAISRPQNTVL